MTIVELYYKCNNYISNGVDEITRNDVTTAVDVRQNTEKYKTENISALELL